MSSISAWRERRRRDWDYIKWFLEDDRTIREARQRLARATFSVKYALHVQRQARLAYAAAVKASVNRARRANRKYNR